MILLEKTENDKGAVAKQATVLFSGLKLRGKTVKQLLTESRHSGIAIFRFWNEYPQAVLINNPTF